MEITLDDLLKTLEDAKNDKLSQSNKKVRKAGDHKLKSCVKQFIQDFNIQTGTARVPNYVIFYTYKVKWQARKKSNKTNKINFFRTFKKYFGATVRTGKRRYYLLDESSFDMSREGLLEAKKYDEKYTKTIKTLNEKKKSKVSKPKEGPKSQE